MAELKVLQTFRQECVANCVEHIKALLTKAESGEIICIASAVVYADGSTGNGWSKHDEYAKLLGAVARLQTKLATA